MAVKSKTLEQILCSKLGFTKRGSKRSRDHHNFILEIQGLPLIQTKLSHSKKDIQSGIQSKIARQMRVRPNFLTEIIKCTRDQAAYINQVRTDPYPPFSVVV
jgi:hypothetical protein